MNLKCHLYFQYFGGSNKTYCLYESNVITEFLDGKFSENEADRLYPPDGSLERLHVYMWQNWDWEIAQVNLIKF